MLEVQIGNQEQNGELKNLNLRRQDTVDFNTSVITEAKDLNLSLRSMGLEYSNLQNDIVQTNLDQIQEIPKSSIQSKRATIEKDKKTIEMIKSILIKSNRSGQTIPRRLMRAISLLVNVKAFYRQLSKNSRIYEKLSHQQHNIIGDVSSFYKNNGYQQNESIFVNLAFYLQRFYQIVLKRIINILPKIPIFSPQSTWKRFWDMIQALLIILMTFMLSLQNFFLLDITPYLRYFLVTLFAFILDILFSFNTAIIEKGNVNTNRKEISINYFKRNFILDCIGITPLILLLIGVHESMYKINWTLNLLIIVKFVLLSDIIERIVFYLNYQKNLKNFIDLAKLLFQIGCVCHFFCILWHGLGLYEVKIGYQNTWLHAQNLVEESSILKRYITSFYYLGVTMITVGYGDITPQNSLEMSFTILTMFFCGFFYAFSLNKIGSILNNIERKNISYKESMQIIHGYMRDENVSSILRAKIQNYLEYLYKVNSIQKTQSYKAFIQKESNEIQKNHEKQIIDKLSNQLKDDLILDVQGKYIQNIPILNRLNSMKLLIYIMEECLYSPGEYIFRQNEIDDSALCLLVKGKVKIIAESKNKDRQEVLLKTIDVSQQFGEISFITGNCRTASAIASGFCTVYKIKRDRFLDIIKANDQDFENFQMIVETLNLKNNFKFVNIRCFQCGQGDHYSVNCPKTHLTFSKQVLINRSNNSLPHIDRQIYQRKNLFNKQNSLSSRQNCINAIYEINNNQDYFDILDEIEFGLDLDEYTDSQLEEGLDENSQSVNHLNQTSKNYQAKENNQKSKMNEISEGQGKTSQQFIGNDQQRCSILETQKKRKSLFNNSSQQVHSQIFSKSQLNPNRHSLELSLIQNQNKSEVAESQGITEDQHSQKQKFNSSNSSNNSNTLYKETETVLEEEEQHSQFKNNQNRELIDSYKIQQTDQNNFLLLDQIDNNNNNNAFQFTEKQNIQTLKTIDNQTYPKQIFLSKDERNEIQISIKNLEEEAKSSIRIIGTSEFTPKNGHSTKQKSSFQIPSNNSIQNEQIFGLNQGASSLNKQKLNSQDQNSKYLCKQINATRDYMKQQSTDRTKKLFISKSASLDRVPSLVSFSAKNINALYEQLQPNQIQQSNGRGVNQNQNQQMQLNQLQSELQFQQNLINLLQNDKRQIISPLKNSKTINQQMRFEFPCQSLQSQNSRINNIYKKQNTEKNNLSQQYIQFQQALKSLQEKKGFLDDAQLKEQIQIISNQSDLALLQGFQSEQAQLFRQQINQRNQELDSNYFMLQRFDKAKIFAYYYPHYNYTTVIGKSKASFSKNNIYMIKNKLKNLHLLEQPDYTINSFYHNNQKQ